AQSADRPGGHPQSTAVDPQPVIMSASIFQDRSSHSEKSARKVGSELVNETSKLMLTMTMYRPAKIEQTMRSRGRGGRESRPTSPGGSSSGVARRDRAGPGHECHAHALGRRAGGSLAPVVPHALLSGPPTNINFRALRASALDRMHRFRPPVPAVPQ